MVINAGDITTGIGLDTMNIPFAKPVFLGKEKEYLADAIGSGWISDGPYVERFTQEFLSHFPGSCGVTTSNGTTALHLALLALGIGPGDEVIVPGYTFVAPVNMALAVGATPIYAEIDPQTWCVDPASVEALVTPQTKAIIAVHIYGNVCDMTSLRKIADKHHIYLIEDVAQAAFGRHAQQYAGSFADIGCFSFQATKTIAMGEGGFVLTRDKNVFDKMQIIRDHGMNKEKRYWHEEIGYNFRLTNLQAALGCAQLEYVKEIISRRKKIQNLYENHLANQEGITLQLFDTSTRPVVWSMGAKIDPQVFRKDREQVRQSLKLIGIETRPGFYGFHRLPPYQSEAPELAIAGSIGEQIILLPSFISLREEEIVFICEEFKKLREQVSIIF
jgi:perosamine synthetase